MTGRIRFPGNPWPEGHAVEELRDAARGVDGLSLQEAAAWCAGRPFSVGRDNGSIEAFLRSHPLRSVELQPTMEWTGHEAPGEEQVAEVVQRRRGLVRPGPVPAGRLLCAALDESVWCGAAAAASDGFFDEGDVPAWDTWVGFLPEKTSFGSLVLLSWVPEAYVELVEHGIQVNPVKCIYWHG